MKKYTFFSEVLFIEFKMGGKVHIKKPITFSKFSQSPNHKVNAKLYFTSNNTRRWLLINSFP